LIYPELADVPVWFRFDVDEPDITAVMGAVQTFCNLGGSLIEDDVRGLLPGMRSPQPGDKTLGGQQQPIPGMPTPNGQSQPPQAITDEQPTEGDFQDIQNKLGA
jgi:hypothetical protein